MLGTTTGNIGALNAALAVAVEDTNYFTVQLNGTWAGTISFEATVDGTNWVSLALVNSSSTALTTGVVSTVGNGIFFHPSAFANQFRVRFSAYTSGTASVTFLTTRISK